MHSLVDSSKASTTNFIQPCVAANGHLGPGGVSWPPRVMRRGHE